MKLTLKITYPFGSRLNLEIRKVYQHRDGSLDIISSGDRPPLAGSIGEAHEQTKELVLTVDKKPIIRWYAMNFRGQEPTIIISSDEQPKSVELKNFDIWDKTTSDQIYR